MNIDLAVGYLGGRWERIEVSVPDNVNPRKMTEAELADLLPERCKKGYWFIHLLYAQPLVDEDWPTIGDHKNDY